MSADLPPLGRMTRHCIDIDGVLLLDKPAGVTSNAILQRIKRLYRASKAGHGGTLDPMATGLLPLAMGEATKFLGSLLEAHKTYKAVVRFGVRTTTGDAEGAVVERRPVSLTPAQLEVAMSSFTGKLWQVPPMHSAVKRNGRPLYRYARQGLEVERQARQVEIYRLEIEAFHGEGATLLVECSKGTYVRTLAEDLGTALGCGAHLEALQRISIGAFSIEQAVTPSRLEALTEKERRALLLPVDAPLASLPRLDVAPAAEQALLRGQPIAGSDGDAVGLVRLYADRGRFLGVGESIGNGWVRPRRLIRPERRM